MSCDTKYGIIVKKGHLQKFFKLLSHHSNSNSIPYTKKASKAFVWLVFYRYLMSKVLYNL